MSGVIGIVQLDGSPVEGELLHDLTTCLAFRGPDGLGQWREGPVGLGHALYRATREPQQFPQPGSLDGEVWISADARLDGRQELIDRLQPRRRATLVGASDAELILHAYAAWGDECVQYLLGDFAFVLWDCRRRRLLGAVDHFGVKGLYFAHTANSLVVSNTLQCVRRHPDVSDRLNEVAVGDFLAFGYYQSSDLTIFADVERLRPAHCLVWEHGRLRHERYWSVPRPEPASFRDNGECEARFHELLGQAVSDRLRGRRVGLFLSGGIDSALLAVTARRLGAPPLKAFTVVYDWLIPDDERYYSRLVAEALQIPQTVQAADDFQLYKWVRCLDWPPPEPVNDPSWDFTVGRLREVAAECPVMLTGLDGDSLLHASLRQHCRELLQAGRWRQMARDLAWYFRSQRRLPPLRVGRLLKRLRRRPARQRSLPEWLNPAFRKRINLPARWEAYTRPRPPAQGRGRASENLTSPFWASVLDKYDPTWTGMSLDVRHPLMDVRLVSFLLSLPTVPWCVNKELFRRALRPSLPRVVCRRPKTVLRRDPIAVALWERGERWEKALDFRSEISSYVDLAALPEPTRAASTDETYAWLRPISLGMWLNSQRGKHRENPCTTRKIAR